MTEQEALSMLCDSGYLAAYKPGTNRVLSLREAIDQISGLGTTVQLDFRHSQVWLWATTPSNTHALPLWCVNKIGVSGLIRDLVLS